MRDGLAGQAVVTGRPNCARTVPAQILKRLAGLPERSGTQPLKVNWVMCFGQAALLGVLRSVMAQSGPQGPLITNNKVAQFVARSDGRLRGAAGADLTRPVQAVDELRAAEFGGDRNIPFTPRKAAVQVVRYAQSKRTLPERDATRAGTPGPSCCCTMRRPVFPVAPVTRIVSLLMPSSQPVKHAVGPFQDPQLC